MLRDAAATKGAPRQSLRNHPIFSYEVNQRCYLLFFLVLTWEADLDLKRSVTIIQKEKDRTKEGGDDGPGG